MFASQRFGRLDSSQTQDEGIEPRFQSFADTVAIVALSKSDVPCQSAPQSKALKEMLDQSHAAELRPIPSAEICRFRGPRRIVPELHF
jgi:hypothetical protein